MITGSYRLDQPLEVWDLRMFKRSKVIDWEGTGQQLFTEGQEEEDETKSEFKDDQSTMSRRTLNSSLSTASIARVSKKPKGEMASFLYTTMFSKDQSLLFAGGSGMNEMRIFDWESGNIVARIDHLPKSILCGAVGNNSDMFMFGSADSRARVFEV